MYVNEMDKILETLIHINPLWRLLVPSRSGMNQDPDSSGFWSRDDRMSYSDPPRCVFCALNRWHNHFMSQTENGGLVWAVFFTELLNISSYTEQLSFTFSYNLLLCSRGLLFFKSNEATLWPVTLHRHTAGFRSRSRSRSRFRFRFRFRGVWSLMDPPSRQRGRPAGRKFTV